ncbi:MAG: MFS transporter [Propioniciclava sp.]|uniref:MFS transporter n=1 Tax=Propioniciclava sp. TaxID=2038686 RepID=UPI0039E6FA05
MSPSTQPVADATARLPLVTYVLAAGVFLMGTSEFIVAGILPEIAADLGISIAQTGLMITIFAIGMIVGTPAMAAITLKLSRRVALGLSLIVFSAGHVIVAAAGDYTLILAARFLTALATGGFWAVAAVVAAQTAGVAMASRAVGIVLGGGMVANVLGVPLGSFAGQAIGWRGPFWALAVLAVVGAFAVYRLIPADAPGQTPPSLASELKALRDGRVLLVLACCAVVTGSALTVYSFISPLVTDVAGLPNSAVPLILVVYGLGAAIGSYVGGRVGDRNPFGLLWGSATATFVVLVALVFLSRAAVPAVVLLILLGLFGMSTNPVLIGKAVGYAKDAPTLASAMCTSMFNVGTAIGTWVAGFAIESSLGATGPVVVGAVIGVLYFLPLGILARHPRR